MCAHRDCAIKIAQKTFTQILPNLDILLTNCNMPPEKCPVHLLRILISVNGNTESFYRLLITSANTVMEQVRNAVVLSKFQWYSTFLLSHIVPPVFQRLYWLTLSSCKCLGSHLSSISTSRQVQSLFLKFLTHSPIKSLLFILFLHDRVVVSQCLIPLTLFLIAVISWNSSFATSWLK